MRGGNPGVRLIEPQADASPAYFAAPPAAFARRPDQWWVIPLYEVFGSEELSRRSPPVAELVPPAYLALNAEDAKGLGLADGGWATLTLGGRMQRLIVRVRPALPAGLVGVVAGLSFTADLPAWARIAAIADERR